MSLFERHFDLKNIRIVKNLEDPIHQKKENSINYRIDFKFLIGVTIKLCEF